MNRFVSMLVLSIVIHSSAYNIQLSIPNAQSYHDQSHDENSFRYGYRVENINNQFQHKRQGSDGVTYGCYGHVDPSGGKQLTFFVADRLGYRVVLTDQPTTVYPVSSEDAGISGGQLIQWNDLPFPDACRRLPDGSDPKSSFDTSQAGGIATSPNNGQFDESSAGESRDAAQRTLASETRNHLVVVQPFDNELQATPVPRNAVQSVSDGPLAWQFDTSNNGAINAHQQQATSGTGTTSQPSAKGQSGSVVNSWRSLLTDGVGGAAFMSMLTDRCENTDEQHLTFYMPFRVACSDMRAFEAELAKLTAQFDRPKC